MEQIQQKVNELDANPQLTDVWRWIIRLGYEAGPEFGLPTPVTEHGRTAGQPTEPKPDWDKEARVLAYAGHRLRHYLDPAEAQIKILDTFHELGWKMVVDSPFPDTPTGKEQLRNAIKNLNAGLEQKDLVEFHGDGSGIHVCWRKL
jgi:hypothetical protein